MITQPRSLARFWQAARWLASPYMVLWSSVETLMYRIARLLSMV